jgi:hypothetical protein
MVRVARSEDLVHRESLADAGPELADPRERLLHTLAPHIDVFDLLVRDDAHARPPVLGDHDLLSGAGALDQLRQAILGFEKSERGHGDFQLAVSARIARQAAFQKIE